MKPFYYSKEIKDGVYTITNVPHVGESIEPNVEKLVTYVLDEMKKHNLPTIDFGEWLERNK